MSACRQSFSRKVRLTTKGEFDFVFKRPFKSSSRGFTVLARYNQGQQPRLGLIISKRCAKNAVQRNRLKRLIRQSFRLNQEQLAKVDIVVIGQAAAVTKSNDELFSLLTRHWSELERCKKL